MTDKNTTQIVDASENEYTELVVGFVIVSGTLEDGRRTVRSVPVSTNYQNEFDFETLDINEEVVGVLPAPKGSLSVYKYDSKGECHHLGYKYPGVYFP